jgi:hypothetical protein
VFSLHQCQKSEADCVGSVIISTGAHHRTVAFEKSDIIVSIMCSTITPVLIALGAIPDHRTIGTGVNDDSLLE